VRDQGDTLKGPADTVKRPESPAPASRSRQKPVYLQDATTGTTPSPASRRGVEEHPSVRNRRPAGPEAAEGPPSLRHPDNRTQQNTVRAPAESIPAATPPSRAETAGNPKEKPANRAEDPDKRLSPSLTAQRHIITPRGADTFRPRTGPAAAYDTRQEPKVIRVSIGRIEVRAAPAPPVSPPPAARQPGPRLSLDDYLRSRRGGTP
jgi:hypothetical protein